MDYETVKAYWNQVFSTEQILAPRTKRIGNETLDNALDWLCEGAESILDFGCGNGLTLFLCALRGTKRHRGIDLSRAGISHAEQLFGEDPSLGEGTFWEGGVELLFTLPSNSMDGAILFNVTDNLLPADAALLIKETARILKPGGRALLKLNPHLTAEQIVAWNIKTIEGDFLDDGLFLWNKDTRFWRTFLAPYYNIVCEADVYYEEHDRHNRLFLLAARKTI